LITGVELVPGTGLAESLVCFLPLHHWVAFCPFFFMLAQDQHWPRRGHLQIMTEILEIASREGATKTAIVYKANINFTLANRYLEHLEERGLIGSHNGGSVRVYTLTERGREALFLLRKTVDEVLEGRTVVA